MPIIICALAVWAVVWAAVAWGFMPFLVSAIVFVWWIATFVHLERMAATQGYLPPGALRQPAWSCVWSSLALGACILAFW